MTTNFNTIEQQVSLEVRNELGFRNLTSKLKIHETQHDVNLIIPYESILNEYRYYLMDYIYEVELDDISYELYRQNPQALSEALYGTIHMWHSLLELNHCVSRIEFNSRKVKYYDPGEIMALVNDIKLKNAQVTMINI